MLLLLQDEQVIEALTSHTAQQALTDGIGARRMNGRFQYLDASGGGHASETGSKLVITIADEILRTLSISRGFPKLLCGPSIRGRSRDADVDDSARVQFDDEESKKRTEAKVSHWQKVAGPDLLGMGANERPPGLSSWPLARTCLMYF